MLQMLPEMIRSEELLVLVAFSVLVRNNQMLCAEIPIWFRLVRKLCSTIAAIVECAVV
jgi:hypothetical protein